MALFDLAGLSKSLSINNLPHLFLIVDDMLFPLYNIQMSSDKPDMPRAKKLEAVKTYLTGGQSLRKVAKQFGIAATTLWDWVKLYQEGGETNLEDKRPGKRKMPQDIETKVMLAKENRPSLSVKHAQHVLERDGIAVSTGTIYNIWKRYALLDPLNSFSSQTTELDNSVRTARKYIAEGNIDAAATLLNSLPSIPNDEIIKQIPEERLSLRRRLDRLQHCFGQIPFPEYAKKLRRLGKMLEHKGLILSSIQANYTEALALSWIGEPEEELTVLKTLEKKIRGIKNSGLWLRFYSELTKVYCDLEHIDRAIKVFKKCRVHFYALSCPTALDNDDYANVLTYLGHYREAYAYHQKAFKLAPTPFQRSLMTLRIATDEILAGEYEKTSAMLKKTETIGNHEGLSTTLAQVRACVYFGLGELSQATECHLEALEKASKGEVYTKLFSISIGLAGVAMALNKRAQATLYLKKYVSLLRGQGLAKLARILQVLHSHKPIPAQECLNPMFNLLHLLSRATRTMKISDYRKAFRFAERQKILGLFHRWIVFFPDLVLKLLDKGVETGLPKTFLKFPIFNQNVPVYHIKLLGNVVIFKNQHYVKATLSPREAAFLIHIALMVGAPGKSMLVPDLYQNFWSRSANAQDRLLHLLANLKKKLRIPTHVLSITSIIAEPRLLNRGIYITTDYAELEALLTQTRSLEQADEWQYAKRDYERAFKLVRGAPFEKMYDAWSETMRGVILNKLEAATIQFARSCLNHNDRDDARRILKRMFVILPLSQEIVDLSKTLHA